MIPLYIGTGCYSSVLSTGYFRNFETPKLHFDTLEPENVLNEIKLKSEKDDRRIKKCFAIFRPLFVELEYF